MNRVEAIRELENLAWVQGGPDRNEVIEAIYMAIDALQFQDIMVNNPKSAKPTPEVCKNCKDNTQNDWTPVSEPPKENGNYIVSLEDAVDTFARFFNGKWFMPPVGSIAREYGEHEVIAWQPLPESYKGGDTE